MSHSRNTFEAVPVTAGIQLLIEGLFSDQK
jgi:hypothetical protein